MKRVIILLLILTVIGGVSFSLYSIFTKKGQVIQQQADIIKNQEEQKLDKDNQEALLNIKLEEIRKTDSDLDGLSDGEEKKIGTNPSSVDTDVDGLRDKAEIEIYKTNPLKADTDGDGLGDGYEVAHSKDPSNK